MFPPSREDGGAHARSDQADDRSHPGRDDDLLVSIVTAWWYGRVGPPPSVREEQQPQPGVAPAKATV
jgi:hypothetical protein